MKFLQKNDNTIFMTDNLQGLWLHVVYEMYEAVDISLVIGL